MIYGILFTSSFLLSLVLLYQLFRVRNIPIATRVLAGAFLTSLWLFAEMFCYYVRNPDLDILVQNIKYVSPILIPPLFLLVAYSFVSKEGKGLLYNPFIFVVPGLSLLSLITNRFPYPFLVSTQMVYQGDTPRYLAYPAIGFWIHTYYSYALILTICCMLLVYAIKSPKLYRTQSIFIFTGTVFSLLINLVSISGGWGSNYMDLTSISILATLEILYWGLFRFPRMVIQPYARDLVIENLKDMVIILDSTGQVVDVNPAVVEFLNTYGIKKPKFHLQNGLHQKNLRLNDLMALIPGLKLDTTTIGPPNCTTLTLNQAGKMLYLQVDEAPIRDAEKAQIGKLYMLHDITQMQEYTNNLKSLNDALVLSDRVINGAAEGVLITDPAANIVRLNSSFEKMSGYNQNSLLGQNPRIFQSGRHDSAFYTAMWQDLTTSGHWEGEIWNRRKNGEIYPNWMTITALTQPDGAVENYICISTDISKIKKTEDALQYLSYYDALTGIPNRTLFYERLERALVRSKRSGKSVALFFMDLDKFSMINAALGHSIGDLLLKEMVERVKAAIRESDTISRISGDDFAVILEDVESIDEVKRKVEGLIAAIIQPYHVSNREIILGVNVGIALAPEDDTSVVGLMRKADAAMLAVRESGRGSYSFSSEEAERKNQEIVELQSRLNRALVNREFRLYLQPQIAVLDQQFEVVGAEALIRWQTTDGTVIAPDKFIPLIESNGMIIPVGDWILEEIFQINQKLKANGIDIKLAINVSSKQFENGKVAAKVKELVEKYQAQPIALVVEITESFLLKDYEHAVNSLIEIKKLGIDIALDDFGTGFSSLSYLTHLPIDYLKIDKSFIQDLDQPDRVNLTPNIIAMSQKLNLKTVAEGVETSSQIERLVHERCDQLQGYFFSKPLELNEFIRFVGQHRSRQRKPDEGVLY